MPKKGFEKLSEIKKEKLLDAAYYEFSNNLLKDASINQIIKKAGISRGSFYTYFDDINDLYEYLIIKDKETLEKEILNIVRKNNDDLYQAFLNIFEFIASDYADRSFVKNMFININLKSKATMHKGRGKEKVQYILSTIDKNKLSVKEKELENLIEILVLLLVHSLVILIKEKENYKDSLKNYKTKLKIILTGVQKGI